MQVKMFALIGMGFLVSATPAPGQIFGTGLQFVSEVGPSAANHAITAVNSVTTAVNVAASYVRQGQQLINEYNIIRQQISQYETMIRNLQRIGPGLNFFDTVTSYGQRLTSLLAQSNTLSYDLNTATEQFQALYDDAETVALGDLRPVTERFYRARMGASTIAVQVQSMQSNITDLFSKLCALLDGSYRASGALDSHQIAAQQQALQTTTLQQIQALQMVSQRLEAQRQAEEIALARLKQRVQDEFVRALPAYTGEQGTLPSWQWVTTTSQGD